MKIPYRTVRHLWHLGILDPAKKSPGPSYEGDLLSAPRAGLFSSAEMAEASRSDKLLKLKPTQLIGPVKWIEQDKIPSIEDEASMAP